MAERNASAKSLPAHTSFPSSPVAMPLKNWDKITPLLPRASQKVAVGHLESHLAGGGAVNLRQLFHAGPHGQQHIGAGIPVGHGIHVQKH